MYHFWAAGVVARAGGNPYVVSEIHKVMLDVGWPPQEVVFGFLHPFWSLWLFTLLSMVPFPFVKLVSEVTIIIVGGLSIALMARPHIRRLLGIHAPTSFLIFASLLFPPTISTLYSGQVSVVTLLGIAGWLILSLRKNYFCAGALLSLTAIKPQLFVPFYLWVFLSHIRRKEPALVVGLMVGLLLQAGISLLFAPHSAAQWIEAMQRVSHAAVQLPTPSLVRLLSLASGIEQIPLACMVGVAAITIVLAILNKGEILQNAVMVYLPLSLLVAPYTWTHGLLALLPAQLSFLSRLWADKPKTAQYGVFTLATIGAFELAMPRTLSQYMVLLPIALLIYGLSPDQQRQAN
jgi:hypothetical protein